MKLKKNVTAIKRKKNKKKNKIKIKIEKLKLKLKLKSGNNYKNCRFSENKTFFFFITEILTIQNG